MKCPQCGDTVAADYLKDHAVCWFCETGTKERAATGQGFAVGDRVSFTVDVYVDTPAGRNPVEQTATGRVLEIAYPGSPQYAQFDIEPELWAEPIYKVEGHIVPDRPDITGGPRWGWRLENELHTAQGEA